MTSGPRVAHADAPEGAVPPDASADPTSETEHDDTARALERALVRQGGLVLQPWTFELEPSVVYEYRESSELRRDTLTGVAALRVGLPWGAQGDVRVPYVIADRQAGVATASGLGDVGVGLTKQLYVGGPRRPLPDLLIAGRWKTTTGSDRGRLPTGTGTHGLELLATAVGRDDPLVVVVTLFYAWNLSSGTIAPGDAVGGLLRLLLAATPSTSVVLGLDAASFSATRVAGRSIPESDRLIAILNVGLQTILRRDVFFDVTLGVGVTPAAPPFTLGIAVPIRR